jgi:hypothetical protein
MAKLSHLREFIERETTCFGTPTSQNEKGDRRRIMRRQLSDVRNFLDEAAIWRRAVQLEFSNGSDQTDACKPQKDFLQNAGDFAEKLQFSKK